jgi:hypothetical protein
MLKGTTNGVISDVSGKFSINNVSEGGILVISYVGYLTQEIPIGNETSLQIRLKEDVAQLNEIVVVGYGVQTKATLTGAVTVVSDKQLQDKGTLSSPLQAMQRQAPGVIITRNSSAPGDESWDMKFSR